MVCIAYIWAHEYIVDATGVRTRPMPMMPLAGSMDAFGHLVVLASEGADEVFSGCDLLKESKGLD